MKAKRIAKRLLGAVLLGCALYVYSKYQESEEFIESLPAHEVPIEYKGKSRSACAEQLTEKAKSIEFLAEFQVDPNDDKTLMITRATDLKPEEVKDWDNYILSCGLNRDDLLALGFNKVRIYTSLSKGISDYKLEIL